MVIDRERLIKKINSDLQKKTAAQLAIEIGIPAMTLGRIVRGKSRGNIGTWESIAGFYSNNKSRVSA